MASRRPASLFLLSALSLLTCVVSAAGCYAVVPAYGTATVEAPVISRPPPPPRTEAPPAAPMRDAVWVPGHWAWTSATGWQWVAGRYEKRPGHVWVAPRYVRLPGGGWAFVRGHWRRVR